MSQISLPVATCIDTPIAKKRLGARARRRAQRLTANAGALFGNIASDCSTVSRKQRQSMDIYRYLPRDTVRITNTGFHNLTLPLYGLCNIPRVLSALEEQVLSFGTQFVLAPKYLCNTDIDRACDYFSRAIRIKYHFTCNPTTPRPYTALDKLIHKRSAWVPPDASIHIEGYLSHVRSSLHNCVTETMNAVNKRTRNYHKHTYYLSCMVSKLIRKGITSLRNDDSIVLKKSDKNLGVCVLPRVWYESQAMCHLTDNKTYVPLSTLPSITHVYDKLRAAIFGYDIPADVKDFLFSVETACIATGTAALPLSKFYLLPKIHKHPISTRPIVASIGSCTYNVSKYIDFILKPVMRTMCRILHSSVQLLRHLNTTSFPADCSLFTADVTSLYPSIDIEDGLRMIGVAIVQYNDTYKCSVNNVLVVALCRWVLTNNYICFGESHWLQIRGTAMGTPMAVVFANIYLAMLEADVFSLYYALFPPTEFDTILLYVRYIDDILAVVSSATQGAYLLQLLDHMHENIRLTHVVSNESVDFLDLTVCKGATFPHTSLLDVKPYQKPMNAYLYIPVFSHHNQSMFKGFIRSELRRYMLNSTCMTEYHNIRSLFRQRLLNRGYPPKYLDEMMEVVYDRSQLLFPPHVQCLYNSRFTASNPRPASFEAFESPICLSNAIDNTCNSVPIVFKLPFTPTVSKHVLGNILNYFAPSHTLQYEPWLRSVFEYRRHPIMCFTRTASVGDLLIQAKYAHDTGNMYGQQ